MSEGRHEGRTKIIGTVRKKVDRGPWIAESDIVDSQTLTKLLTNQLSSGAIN